MVLLLHSLQDVKVILLYLSNRYSLRPEKLRQQHKSAAGLRYPVLEKIAIMLMEDTDIAQRLYKLIHDLLISRYSDAFDEYRSACLH
jgi:hypothetical protein